MEEGKERRMWLNLIKGATLLLGGVVAVLLIDLVFDKAKEDGNDGSSGDFEWDRFFESNERDYLTFAFEGDGAGLGIVSETPVRFATECFDPVEAGEVRSTYEGTVVQIVSDFDSDRLFDYCEGRLRDKGWRRVDAGLGTRASFVKDSGLYRWLYLVVEDVGFESSAVLVLKEAA